jgi:hypothetical protein
MSDSRYQTIGQDEIADQEAGSQANRLEISGGESLGRKNPSAALFVVFAVVLAACIGVLFDRSTIYGRLLGTGGHDDVDSGYDFIVVGGGPAGSTVTRQLVDAGAKVLLLEAGGATQRDLMGKDYFGGPVTRFDIPLLWSAIHEV